MAKSKTTTNTAILEELKIFFTKNSKLSFWKGIDKIIEEQYWDKERHGESSMDTLNSLKEINKKYGSK